MTVIVRPLRSEEHDAIRRLHDDTARTDGHPSLGESVWRDLDHPPAATADLVAVDRDTVVGYVHVGPPDTASGRPWELGCLVGASSRGRGLEEQLVDAALDHVAVEGGGDVVLWWSSPSGDDDARLRAAGWRPDRELHQMRVALPLAERPAWPAGVGVRTFEPGRDEDAWLAVNNRAFAGHPEQGGWTRATLQRRTSAPWFDPSLFLLATDTEGIVGFDWLKVHEPSGPDPRLGEIFAIGVDPRGQGTGLGRALAVGGLALVAERGVRTGMLYVDGANDAARGLYRSLGFSTHHVDRAYARTVTPSPPRP